MASHFKKHHGNDPTSLLAIGIDHVPISDRRGDRQKRLNQKETEWIYRLRATSHPGINDDLDLSPFL